MRASWTRNWTLAVTIFMQPRSASSCITCLQVAKAWLQSKAGTDRARCILCRSDLSKDASTLRDATASVTIPGRGAFDSFISKADIQGMAPKAWPGKTLIITTPAQAAAAVHKILQRCSTATAASNGKGAQLEKDGVHRSGLSAAEAASVLGFDIECKPVFEAGVRATPALVQVATPGAVYLFHISCFRTSRKFKGSQSSAADALQVWHAVSPFSPLAIAVPPTP